MQVVLQMCQEIEQIKVSLTATVPLVTVLDTCQCTLNYKMTSDLLSLPWHSPLFPVQMHFSRVANSVLQIQDEIHLHKFNYIDTYFNDYRLVTVSCLLFCFFFVLLCSCFISFF